MPCPDCKPEFDALKLQVRQAERATEKSEVKRAVERDAIAAGVLPVALEDVLTRAADGLEWGTDSRGRVRRLVNGQPEVDENGEYVTPARWLRSMKAKAPHWFGEPQSPASGDIGPNPFAKGPNFNLTKGAQLLRDHPAEAKRLAAAANYQLPALAD